MAQSMECVTLTVNGRTHRFLVGDAGSCVAPSETRWIPFANDWD